MQKKRAADVKPDVWVIWVTTFLSLMNLYQHKPLVHGVSFSNAKCLLVF